MMDMRYNQEADDVEYSLTTYQRDIWVEQCLHPGKPIYNLGGFIKLEGELNYDVLNRAINILIMHHDSLRMRVSERSGRPFLKILPEVAYKVPFFDFSGRRNAHADCLDWMNNAFLIPFDFQDHLFEFALLKADQTTYFWFIKFHHIIIDGFGLALMYNQVIENYNQLMSGIENIQRITYSYTDFIAEHQDYLNSASFLKDKAFWKEKFEIVPEPLFNQGASGESDAASSITSERVIFDLSRSLYNQMIAFSKENGCTVFHFILGVLSVYFSRVCHKEDVVIGVPLLNRGKAKYKQILGLFTNVIPLKIHVEKNISFKKLMLMIRNELAECYRHQKFPFGEIYRTAFENLKDKKNIFDISLSYINRDFDESYSTAGQHDIISMSHHHERNAVTIFIREYDIDRDVHVDFDYQPKIFEKWLPIKNVIVHFEYLLGEMIQNGDKNLNEIEIIPTEEQYQLLSGFNHHWLDYPSEKTIQELFEDQVARTPDRPAIVFGDQRFSYRELNARVNQLARVLRNKGVKREQIVGLMVDRSPARVVGMLGILKAGGAYLPLDPDYPSERLQYMLKDSSVEILLTQGDVGDGLDYCGQVINIEDNGIYQDDVQNPMNVNTSRDLAYIIYTSGSTGKPKGVMIEHRGVANLKTFFEKNYHVNADDRMLQFASSSFDASVWEIFTSLLVGAALYLVPKKIINHFGEFEKFIDQNGITIALLPPTYLAGMEPRRVPKLKQLFTGGSAITKDLVEKWREQRLYRNAYGPTEATIIATVWGCPKEGSDWETVPIGVPVANTEIFILDRFCRLLPAGVPGELCIGGVGLARGYLNRLDLTNEKFVANPYRNGERIYKTGDLARWLPDGNIEYLGRIDHQVKVRGFRIELGEIEAQLRRDARVKEAVAVAWSDSQGQQYLAAYFTGDIQATEEQLRAGLLKTLPDYMVPAYLIRLDQIPLTPNGKVDVKALPQPTPETTPAGEYQAPRTETEAILVELWQQVLNREPIGIKDNFFHLGGDSIKAIQVLSRLTEYGLKLELTDLFEYPVIEELSHHVQKGSSGAEQGLITGEIPLTPIQHWFFEQPFLAKHHFNQWVMLRPRERFKEDLLRGVLEQLVEHHDALRIIIKHHEKLVLFNRGFEEPLYSWESLDLRNGDDAEEAIAFAINRIQAGFNLSSGPLFKAALFKTDDGDRLLLVIHHLVVDGVSWRIILEDLFAGYLHALKNEAIRFPAKTDSFRDWSTRLAVYANSPAVSREVTYWSKVKATEITPLPKDQSLSVRKYRDNVEFRLELTVSETEKLLTSANRAYNTEINDILLTALALAIREWTGREQVFINLEGHGREALIEEMDISRTVGWFTVQYPVILEAKDGWDLAYQIKSVKERLRQVPNKGTGYGILKYLTSPGDNDPLDFNLQPEISFNYLGQFDERLGGEEFDLKDVEMGRAIAPDMMSPYALEINGLIIKGKLVMDFAYHQREYRRATVVRFAEAFREKLLAIVAHCVGVEDCQLTPSDFTSKILTLDEFELGLGHLNAANIKDVYRLSPMQEGLLYHALMDKGSPAYVEQVVLDVQGELNPFFVEESFKRLIQRYDIFRTVFVYEKVARPVQAVLKERPASIRLENVSGSSATDKEAFLAEFLRQDRLRGFDLKRDLPLRLTLIQTEMESHRLIWSFHHIIMDGWCLGIILKEFFNMYTGLQNMAIPQLAQVYPYSDYIKWLDRQDQEKAGAYWESYLNGYAETTPLLYKRSGEEIKTGKYAKEELRFVLDEDLTRGLAALARQDNVTLGTVFQAVWGILLMRYNQTDDVVFGTVVSGRPHEIRGIESMIGLFINTLPVRITCDGNSSFSSLLAQVQQGSVASEGYSYYPLAEIQGKCGLQANLFDHIVVFENYPVDQWLGDGLDLQITVHDFFEQTNYDFNLVIIPGKELTVKFIYNALVYKRDEIERLKNHFQTLLQGVRSEPSLAIKELPMLTSEEAKVLVEVFNDTAMEYDDTKTITELFEEQAVRTPDNAAVVFGDERITYSVLNARANQFAGALKDMGVETNDIVGILAERSPEMIIGITAILKAGAAYLPIDPDYPADRIGYMLSDSGARVLLTQHHLLDKIPFDGDIVALDRPSLQGRFEVNPFRNTTSRDLAYVIYTSGSTGKPKGVEIEHASLVNLVSWHRRVYGITAADRATMVAGPAFDAAVWELWPYLVSGAALYIPDARTKTSPPKLAAWLKAQRITVSFMPTPLAEALLAEDWSGPVALRAMLTGGDQLHHRPQPDLPFSLVNHYGPTENTVVATWAQVASGEPGAVLPPIGRPIDNVQIYIVNRHNQLQPLGVPGELCIAGVGLARGYLNRPQLTAEKFVSNPFLPGTRMYRTGDLARWLPDGNIEYLGRNDEQVKIRGFRIELGEIEQQLLHQPAVKEAVVMAREAGGHDKYLAAYVVTEGEMDFKALRERLLQELPEYMVPLYFTRLDQFPVTPNGKIQRKALPEPVGREPAGEKYVAPRNDVDLKIQKVWQTVLMVQEIGIDDDFFLLGGNSIKAIQVVAKLALDFEIGINDIFQCRTIRKLSDTVKYSADRFKAMLATIAETAVVSRNKVFDGQWRSALRDYTIRNRAYERMDLRDTIHYRHILLAGGTGYLGIHLLYQLLMHTDCFIDVPVRGKDDAEAGARLRAKFQFHFKFDDELVKQFETRVKVFRWDLTKANFDLAPEDYAQLARKIDCIINSAANVKHYGHYAEFEAVNIIGNRYLIEFANTGKKKAYNFISTTSVGGGAVAGEASLIFTEYDCDLGQHSDNYYVATKFAAEKSILKSRKTGLVANIFRVGNLVFDSTNGVFQENIADNAFYTTMKSLIKIGCFPEIKAKTLDFSFIDYVAKAILLLFNKRNLQNETYHIFNPHQISLLFLADCLQRAGMRVQTMSVDGFIKYLHQKYTDEALQNDLIRILVHSNLFFEGASKTQFITCHQKTENILKSLDFKWPRLDQEKVNWMLEYCRRVRFI